MRKRRGKNAVVINWRKLFTCWMMIGGTEISDKGTANHVA